MYVEKEIFYASTFKTITFYIKNGLILKVGKISLCKQYH